LLQVDIEALAACRPRIVLARGEHLKLRLESSISPHRIRKCDNRARPSRSGPGVPGRVNIQFMVKLYGDQSAPITPEGAAIASFGRLIGPYTISSAPGSVLNRHGRWKARMPWPKWLIAGVMVPGSGSITIETALPSPPHGNEAGITKDLPAIGIGDVERQGAIGETLAGRVHPVALDGRGADIDVVAVDDMGDELHFFPWFTGRRETPP